MLILYGYLDLQMPPYLAKWGIILHYIRNTPPENARKTISYLLSLL